MFKKKNQIYLYIYNGVQNLSKCMTTRKICVFSGFAKESSDMSLFHSCQTLNLDRYYEKFTRLKQAIEQKLPEYAKWKGVVVHQDIARIHTPLTTHQKLRDLGREVIWHSSYPELEPSVSPFKHLGNTNRGIINVPSKC